MRLTSKTPIPDRGVQGDRLAVEVQRPIGRREGRYDLRTTATAAFVNRNSKVHRDVDRALPNLLRHVFHELRGQAGVSQGWRSSLAMWLPSIVYAAKCSCSRST